MTSQKLRILSHLKRGPITPMQALNLYGCMRLAARVGELKDSGLDIRTQMVERDGKRLAKYWLKKENPPIVRKAGQTLDVGETFKVVL